VLGALILVPAQQELAYDYGSSQLYLIAYAGVFLLVMLVMPRGILPSLTEQWRQRSSRGRPARPSQPTEEPVTS
jgi:branched-chain amino acid transport system permease protein